MSVAGNEADFALGTQEGWAGLQVVRWHAVEEISRPFRYEITLRRELASGPVDLDNG
jgi:hypothetical protein